MHNSNKNVIKLYQYLKQIYPEFQSEKLKMELMYKKIFPEKIYNEKIIRNLIYEFCFNVEKFLSYINYSHSIIVFQKHLLQELSARKLDRLVKENLRSADELLSTQKIKDEDYYNIKVFLEETRLLNEMKDVPMGKSLVLSNIRKEYVKSASNYFLLVILRTYFEKKNSDEQIKSDVEIGFAEYLLKFLDDKIENYKDETVIYLLYKYLKLKEDTDTNEFYNLKNLTISNKEKLSASYFKDFILELYNYCKTQERKGNKIFGYESFELIKYMRDNNLLLENDGIILEHNYTNTVATAIRLKEIDWALDFIKNFKDKLPEKIRENTYCYNMAAVSYITSSMLNNDERLVYLDNALNFLAKVKTSDFYSMTRVNNLQLFIFYEKNDFDPMFNLIDAYRHFLHSNKLIPDALKNRYSCFINFMSRLINIKSGSKNASIEKLKLDVMKAETEYKKWLISRIEEIEKI
ncbi:MAG: hypothetical protein EHM58_03565 [Ignavibacteriae bacterium]|nr:MAG: hypothetical protein EHM58_03565 [Ignavibacteriota bacterium]